MTQIPNDPLMLLSFLNLKLRDEYSSFAELCRDLELSEEELSAKLAAIDYHYHEELNQFR